jgi:hypothetical protein
MIRYLCTVCHKDITDACYANRDPARFGRLHRRLNKNGHELHVETITSFVLEDFVTPSDDKRLHVCDGCVMEVILKGEISG